MCRSIFVVTMAALLLATSRSWPPMPRRLKPRPSATPAWRGGARPSSACSSTGAFIPCPPAFTTASGGRHRRMDHEPRQDSRGRIPAVCQGVQSGEIQRRRVGANRQGRRHEIHRHHLEASRRLCHVRLEGQPMEHLRRHALQARSARGTGGRLPENRASSSVSIIRRRRTGTIPAARPAGGHWDTAQEGDMDEYIDKIAVPQVKEILTNYGDDPAVIWWDTPRRHDPRAGRNVPAAVEAAAGHHHEQPPRRRLQGRHGNAGAAHSRHRLSRTATGKPA